MATKLDMALKYAARGWRVVPLHNPVLGGGCSCRQGQACSSIGKHPRISEWPIKATTDRRTIRRWWMQWPDANIGIATGSISGVFILDVDDKDNGQGSVTLALLEELYGELPLTPVVQTGTGRHYYFLAPGFALNNRVGKAGVGAGLDIRADGGLVVAPGSIHATGAEYEWLNEVPLAPAPQWLIDRIQGGGSALMAVACGGVTPGGLALIPEGERNTGLFLAASSMRGRGMEQEDIERRLLEMNTVQCATPLSVQEIKGIAAGVTRYIPGKRPAAAVGIKKGKERLFWMKVMPQDHLADRYLAMLVDYQAGWRYWLWLNAWCSGGILPNDVSLLARLARARSYEVFEREMGSVLFDFEAMDIDGEPVLINREMAELYAEQMRRYQQKCEASAKAQEAKKLSEKPEKDDGMPEQ